MNLNDDHIYQPMTKEQVLEIVVSQNVRFVALWFTDITGMVKSVTVPAAELEEVLDRGVHFDGSAIEGFARVAESDMLLRPDLSTFTVLPWTSGPDLTARLICTVHTTQGEPFIGDPRNALIRILKQAEDMGFVFKTGMELEFFLFHTDAYGNPVLEAPQDNAGYFDMIEESSYHVRRDMLTTLQNLGIPVESAYSETGAGQQEIDFHYSQALVSADTILTARIALKTVAQRHKLYCTFMPRPIRDMPGSGMHTHQSLHDLQTGQNIFVNAESEYNLSDTARYFLAGQLNHARAMCAVLAPLVNSYKRLGTSFEAPVYVTWAHVNRGALIRVPGTKPGYESHTRLELRLPDPSSNPYLAMAVMLAAGLDGIRQRMSLPEALEESLLVDNRMRLRQTAMLPISLGEALDALAGDDVILGALGPYISDRYIAAKRQEFDAYNRQITEWEISRYLRRF